MIEYSAEQEFIYIDWTRIGAYARLEQPLRLPQKKKYRFTPTARFKAYKRTIGQLTARYHDNVKRELTDTEKWFYKQVEAMTEAEFISLMNCLPGEPITKNSIT